MSTEVDLPLPRAGTDEEDLAVLRQRLCGCFAEGVLVVRVHAEGDVELAVLRALHAAAAALRTRGGSLHLLGADERTRIRVRVHGLDDLLPAVEPYPRTGAGRAADGTRVTAVRGQHSGHTVVAPEAGTPPHP